MNLTGLTLMLGAAGLLFWMLAAGSPTQPATSTTTPTIEGVRQFSRLVVLESPVKDVQVSQLDGRLGGLSLVLIVHGDVQLAAR